MSHRVQVVVRFRPQNETEKQHGGSETVKFPRPLTSSAGLDSGLEEEVDVLNASNPNVPPKQYTFDGVLPPKTTQRQLFEKVGLATVDTVLKGYNGTVLAYGQTGSGKTHSMLGPNGGTVDVLSKSSPFYSERGFLPRVVEALYEKLEALPKEEISWSVTVSVFELYKESIIDLLGQATSETGSTGLDYRIREDTVGGRGIYVENLYGKQCGSAPEVMEALGSAVARRKVSSTKSNETSSRSHSLTVLTVEQIHHVRGDSVTRSRLNVVDLAGSEKVGKTQATGERLKEAQMINLSLTLLGNVIYKLTDGKSVYIPYRDSKLTRLLQESFGGNACTTLLCHASTAEFNREETISTLQFAARAKQIKNKPRVNRQLSGEELQLAYQRAQDEIRSLKDRLAVFEDGRGHGGASALSPQRTRTSEGPTTPLSSRPGATVTASDGPEDLMALLAAKDEEIESLRVTIASLMREKEEISRDVAERDELLEGSRRQVEFYKEKWQKAQVDAEKALELERQMKYKEDLFKRHKMDMEAEIAQLKAQLTTAKKPGSSASLKRGNSQIKSRTSDLEDGGKEMPIAAGSGMMIRRPSMGSKQSKKPMQKKSVTANNATSLEASPVEVLQGPSVTATTGGPVPAPTPPSVGAHVTLDMPEQLIVKDGDKRDILRDLNPSEQHHQPITPPRDGVTSVHGDPAPRQQMPLEKESSVDNRLEAELRLKIAELERELAALHLDFRKTKVKVTDLTLANSQLGGKLEASEEENDRLRKKLDATSRVLEETEKENKQMKDILKSLGIDLEEQVKLLGSERDRNAHLLGQNVALNHHKTALEEQRDQQEICDMVNMELIVKTEDVEACEREVQMMLGMMDDFAVQRATSMSCMRTCNELKTFFHKMVEQLETGNPTPFGTANLEAQRLNLITETQALIDRCAVVRAALTSED